MLTVDYERLGLVVGERVLDVGCGEGRHAFEAYRRGAGAVVTLDLKLTALKETAATLYAMFQTRDGCGTIGPVCGDARQLPLADAAFDRVICAETLEHVPADQLVIAELVRVLRPGGRLAVSVPRYFPERVCWALSRSYYMQEGGHVRIYQASRLVRAFRHAGLRFHGRHHAHALHSPYWWLRCVFGAPEEGARIPSWYHRLLVWDIMHSRSPLKLVERTLNPLIGKSVVLYFDKPPI